MKKLFRLVILICGVVLLSHSAHAKCTLLSCDDTSWVDPNGKIPADVGYNQCWFCGPGPNSCSDNEVVPFLDGVGDVIELWQCSAGLINKFTKYEPGYFCDDSELKSSKGITGIDLANAKKTYRIDGDATSSFSLGDLNAFIGRASCIYVRCNDEYVPNENADKCIPKVSSGSDDTKNGNPTGGGKASSSCTDRCRGMSGVQYTECVTCCKVSEDYADWNGSECVCADKTLDFNVLTQKCETPSEITMTLPEVVVTPECPDTQVTILNQWLIQYAGNSDVISRVQVLLDYCNGEVINITSFNQMFTELQNFIDGLATSAEQDASRRRIEESVSAINSRIGDLDVSVWRNAEGEFNTSRLLSDSIAGVVLGTAGGLITSHVVKKNNIASGFEDIKCAIGGQVVADWGDQFQVGIQ